MGLFRWMVVQIASAFGLLPHQRVRRYKVTLFGEPLGTFTLPIGDHMANPNALLRPVLTPPYCVDFGEYTYYYWAELGGDGEYHAIEFHPPTPELRDEAARFYAVANGLPAPGGAAPAPQPAPARTTEEARLVRAVLERRDADQPYLDYAAWLAAKGDNYGDYIRLTLEIAALPEGERRRERLEVQLSQLVHKSGPRWVLSLAKLGIYPGVHMGGGGVYFPTIFHGPKGVIEELYAPSDALVFPANALRLFRAAPFLRKLTVSHSHLTAGEFAAIPPFAQLESLSLSVAAGTAEDVRRFAESPHLGGLRELTLSCMQIDPEGAEHLARAAWLGQLRELGLSSNSFGDDGAEALAAAPGVAKLVSLDLATNGLTDRGLIALCRSPHLAGLERLNVECNAFTAEGFRALIAAPFARTLTELRLNSAGLTGDAVAVLATGAFPALKTLELSFCEIGEEGMRAVAAAPFFRTLEVFRANGTGAGDATVAALTAHGFLQLRELELAYNALSDAGARALAASKAVTKLTALKLNDNPFRVAGTVALAAADVPKLETLDLSNVACGPEGARALAAAPHFGSLTKLYITSENAGVGGREALEKRFTNGEVTFL